MSAAPVITNVTLLDGSEALVIVDLNAAANELERGVTVGVVVPSDRDHAHSYIVTVTPDKGATACSCPAGQHRRKCKHLRRAEHHVGFDAAALKRKTRDAKILKARVEQMLIHHRWAKVRRDHLWQHCWAQSEGDLSRAAQLFSEIAHRHVGGRAAA